jgi:hypothetical protein
MSRSQRTLLIVLVLALLAVLAVSALHDDGDEAPPPVAAVASEGPEVVTPSQLADFATANGEAIYWIGPREGAAYELTASSGGPTYVRYLRDGAEAGDPRPDFVTVATYPEPDGAAELRRRAREEPAAELGRTDDGALLLTDPSSPKSAYLVYPDADIQIELFSPIPDHARRLAARGEVRPVR